MSRIYEAIRKAVAAHEQLDSGGTTTAEDILSMSYAVASRTSGGATNEASPIPQIPADSLIPDGASVGWSPDKEQMLFYSEASDLPGREQFRTIRTNLYQLREQRGLKVVEIASALSGEGKSFVAANIAHALALPRKEKVLLIDCDLRRGSMAGILGARPDPGIAEYLHGAMSLNDVVQHGKGGSLYLIPSGLRVQDPGELIGSAKLEELFSRLRGMFDWIVVDTPPVLQFIDADVIADLCDGILMVIGAGMTPIQLAKRAAKELKKHRMLGAVLNRVEGTGHASKYFSYYGDARPALKARGTRDE